jgi:adenylate cyclase
MALAFGFIAYSAWVEFRREGSGVGLFDGVALDQTLADLRQDYSSALEAMVWSLPCTSGRRAATTPSGRWAP